MRQQIKYVRERERQRETEMSKTAEGYNIVVVLSQFEVFWHRRDLKIYWIENDTESSLQVLIIYNRNARVTASLC